MHPRFIMRQAATGESMPPESSAITRPRAADREAARPRLLLERIEDAVAQHLDEDGELGVLEVHPHAGGLLDGAAHLAVDLARVQRERLVRAPGA